jgi:hypothetical protein
MRALLLSVGLLGLALLFAFAEPAPASTQRVTSDDVELASEQTSSDLGPTAGKNGTSGVQGRSFPGRNGFNGQRGARTDK